jgi:DNA-binding CsgD family transcriptional regulator
MSSNDTLWLAAPALTTYSRPRPGSDAMWAAPWPTVDSATTASRSSRATIELGPPVAAPDPAVVAGREDRPAYAALGAELVALRLDRDGRRDPDAWLAAADGWRAVAWPRLAVRARLSAAAAFLEVGNRVQAAGELATAERDAAAIESVLLAGAAASMAERAGLGGRKAAPLGRDAVAGADGIDRLTAREREVLELVASGATNRQIGTTLFISDKTASVHVSRILGKLGVTSRHEAATLARRPRRRG